MRLSLRQLRLQLADAALELFDSRRRRATSAIRAVSAEDEGYIEDRPVCCPKRGILSPYITNVLKR